jgi:RimJ/RimL family protein N-acetyltransferase
MIRKARWVSDPRSNGDFVAHPRPDVRIVHLDGHALQALAEGDLASANQASPVPLSAYLAGPDCRGVWHRRSRQFEEDQASTAWVTGIIWDEHRRLAVGRAGYHGPPDASGMVEIGYAVDPAYRRRGYARAALEALLARAAREPEVRTVRVSIRPDNVASYRLASQYGFREVGQQWDDEDGLEIVYEVGAGQA